MNLPLPQLSEEQRQSLARPFVVRQVTEALQQARQSPKHATPVLAKWFRQNRKLGSKDRKRVSDIVYTLIRFEQLLKANGHHSTAEQCLALQHRSPLLSEGSLNERLALHLSLPLWFLEQWSTQIPTDLLSLAHALQQRASVVVRVHAGRATRPQILRDLQRSNISCEPVSGTQFGIRLLDRVHLPSLSLYKNGLIEVQDAASQLFCEGLKIQKGQRILDLCAGAGGKSLALSSMGATVFTQEPRSYARQECKKRAKRARLTIHYHLPQQPVDIVLIDAPCSGTGRLRREPALRWRWMEEDVLTNVPTQENLLRRATQYVRLSGKIVYSTCSLLKEENDHTLDGWRKTPVSYVWPHEWNCDGFAWSSFLQ